VIVYVAPESRPVIVQVVVEPFTVVQVFVADPPVAVAVYEVIADPPSEDDAVHETEAVADVV
jgi:hypothetical protein